LTGISSSDQLSISMARIQLSLPEHFHFSTSLPVRITDLNYGGHLGNDALLGMLHEARVLYLKQFGWTELNLSGTGLIMADSVIIYKGEAFHGDSLKIEVTAAELHKVGFELYYKVSIAVTGKPIAEAKTGMLCFDYQQRKLARLPDEAAERLNENQVKS
jgi:acyl-CoA thioester hydrolase